MNSKTKIKKDSIVVKFAGDSGDGMQLIGYQFTYNAAFNKNKAVNFPEFPSEIRAPRGTIAGVSSFQIHFGNENVLTTGDEYDILVVMNAAAFKSSFKNLKKGGLVILNVDGFDKKSLKLAGFDTNPLENPELHNEYKIICIPIDKLTMETLKHTSLSKPEKEKCRNMFVLGFVSWIFDRKPHNVEEFIHSKFSSKPEIKEANLKALWAGYNYGETSEEIAFQYEVTEAKLDKGKYRGIMGNHAIALGLVAAAEKAKLPLVYCSYPITPASDILKHLSSYLNLGIKSFQAEDEIAAMCAAIGAAYGGALAVTGTSGPGFALKTESINLSVMMELPVVIIDVQRAGPSTGMPTRPEQSDLLFSIYGRPGDSPIPVLAASKPSDCFYMAYEACRIALAFMTPVILLSDAFIANGAEEWKYPNIEELPDIQNMQNNNLFNGNNTSPFSRNEKFVRTWAIPGNPNTIHRIGGLEKDPNNGNVSYLAEDHQKMTDLRKNKIENIVHSIPLQEIDTGDSEGDILIVGWGSTYQTIKSVTTELIKEKYKVSHIHLKYLNPFPNNLGEIIQKFKKIIVPEINTGQLIKLIREKFLVNAIGYNKVQGIPIKQNELKQFILKNIH